MVDDQDFDGIILDSQERFLCHMKDNHYLDMHRLSIYQKSIGISF